ncbi:hypothetical protein Tco_0248060 [Tanacetum coccineum]
MRSFWEEAYSVHKKRNSKEVVFNDDERMILFRMSIQSLAPGLEIDTSLIDTYVSILNYEEKFKMTNMKRHFFYTSMMVPGILEDKTKEIDMKIDAQYDRFHECNLIPDGKGVEKMQMEDVVMDDKDGDADDEGDDHVSDTQDANDEDVETESDEDGVYKYKIRVRNDKDEEMKDTEVERFDKEREEREYDLRFSDRNEFSPVKGNFVPKFQLLVLSRSSRIVADTCASSRLLVPNLSLILTSSNVTTAILKSNTLSVVELRVAKLEKDVSELKTFDHSSEALVVLQSYVPTVVDSYLDTKVRDVFHKELQKHTAYLIHKYSLQHLPELATKPTPTTEQESEKGPSEILKIKKEQAESQKNPQFTIKSTEKAALEEYDLKTVIEDENAMDKGVTDTVKDHKRKHDDDEYDDDEDPPAGLNQGKKTKRRRTKESESSKKLSTTKETPKGKTLTKSSKTGKSAPAKEPVEEPITKVIMDDGSHDVARDDHLPTLNPEWFKQPPWPPTLDLEWNKRQIKNLTQDILLGPAFNLLKGMCSRIIELKFNFQECFNALTDKLDWNNPKGDRYPFDLSKPY